MAFVAPFILQVDRGNPIVLLGGVHVGCYELFGTDRVNTIRDLRDKTVSIPEIESPHHVFVASMASYVGLDPGKDIRFVTQAPTEAVQHLAERKIDALMAFPPLSQELRARRSEEHTSELQSLAYLVCRLLLEKKKTNLFSCLPRQ